MQLPRLLATKLVSSNPDHQTAQTKKARKTWMAETDRRRFLDDIAPKLGVKGMSDWYSVSRKSLIEQGARGLLAGYYGNSIPKAMMSLYPEHPWEAWRFRVVSKRYYQSLDNQRAFLEGVAKHLGLSSSLSSWYQVTQTQVIQLGGSSVLQKYESSLCATLKALYPQHEWQFWKFKNVPRNAWATKHNQLEFMEWAATQLGITSMEGWYKVPVEQMNQLGGLALIVNHYSGSLYSLLATLYPDYKWLEWKFLVVPKGFWADPGNQRRFMDWVADQEGITRADDWYRVSSASIKSRGGARLLSNHFGDSFIAAIKSIYPEHEWLDWKFENAPTGFWTSPTNQRKFLEWVSKQLNATTLESWYTISKNSVLELGGHGLFSVYSSLKEAIMELFPEHPWDPSRFSNTDRTHKLGP